MTAHDLLDQWGGEKFVTCLMTKEPAELTTMKTKLRLPSPTSLTDKLSKLLPILEERAGTDFMYSISDFSSSGRNSEKAIVGSGVVVVGRV